MPTLPKTFGEAAALPASIAPPPAPVAVSSSSTSSGGTAPEMTHNLQHNLNESFTPGYSTGMVGVVLLATSPSPSDESDISESLYQETLLCNLYCLVLLSCLGCIVVWRGSGIAMYMLIRQERGKEIWDERQKQKRIDDESYNAVGQ